MFRDHRKRVGEVERFPEGLGSLKTYIDDQWDAEVVADDVTKKVTKSNYLSALCSQFNMNIIMNLNKLPVFADNRTRYDNNFALSSIPYDFKP